MWSLPLDNVTAIPWESGNNPSFPAFFRGTFFVIGEPLDTFAYVAGWTKGVVYVNGFNLGRYWEVGPQLALYVPAPILKQGMNEVVIFELEACEGAQIVFQNTPVL
jgi:beta-galactosidase